MPKIGFGFTTDPDNLLSFAIREETDCPYSHCFVVADFEDEGDHIYEAVWPVVRRNSGNMYNNEPGVVYFFEVSDEAFKNMKRFAHDSLGSHYTFKNYLAIILKQLGFRSFLEKMEDTKTMVCSEFATRAARAAGIDICSTTSAEIISPSDMLGGVRALLTDDRYAGCVTYPNGGENNG